MTVPLRRPSPCLYRGMKQLIVCDSGDVVAGIVDFVVSQHRVLRLVERAMRPGHPLAVALILLNALRCFVGVDWVGHGAGVIAVAPPQRTPGDRAPERDASRSSLDGADVSMAARVHGGGGRKTVSERSCPIAGEPGAWRAC